MITYVLLVVLIAVTVTLLLRSIRTPEVRYVVDEETKGVMKKLKGTCDELPRKILSSVQGSINHRKGKIGELVAVMDLISSYDTLIPLGQPIDMIGINEDSVDFIEVKCGSGRLTETERLIKELVDEGKVRFIIVRHDIDVNPLASEGGEESA